MTITTLPFNELSVHQLYQILQLREKIFVLEQTCLYQDLDDLDQQALHTFLEIDGRIVAYARVFYRNEAEGLVQIGRVIAEQTLRRQGFATKVMQEAMQVATRELHARQLYLEAQCYAIPFYEKLGFKVCSEEFLEDGIPHVKMIYNSIGSRIS